MKPRHVAQYRISRTVPGEHAGDPRPIPARLQGREDRHVPDHAPCERRVTLWDRRPVPLQGFRMPELGRPTPLLKRLVRHPISMEPEGTRRVNVFDSTRPASGKGDREPVRMVFRERRALRLREAPVDHAPEARPHPFERRREALRESDWHRGEEA